MGRIVQALWDAVSALEHAAREVQEALKPRRIAIATAPGQVSIAQDNAKTMERPKGA